MYDGDAVRRYRSTKHGREAARRAQENYRNRNRDSINERKRKYPSGTFRDHKKALNRRMRNIYMNMAKRCTDPTNPNYPRYGGRGIVMCDEWVREPSSFYQWSAEAGYRDTLTIDRRDNNGPYSPENCRWVTHTVNMRNSSATKLIADEVLDIKERILRGETDRIIVEAYPKITRSCIQAIRHNKSWIKE